MCTEQGFLKKIHFSKWCYIFISIGDTEDVICKNNDEEELKEDKQKDINSSMDSLISRLTSEVDMQSNFKEFIVLTQGKLGICMPLL